MCVNSAAIAEEYVSRMTDDQLQRFQKRWTEFSKKQDLGPNQLLIDSGTIKAFDGVNKKLQAELNAMFERTGMMDDLRRRMAEIADKIDIPQIEFSEETRRNIQRLAGFDVPLDNPVAIARLGAAWLEDPDKTELRADVNAVFEENPELDEQIDDFDVIAVGGGEYVYVSREQFRFGVRLVIFGLWCAISLQTAGAPELAVFVLESIGFDGSLLGGLAIADYLAKRIVPDKSNPQGELPGAPS